MEFFLFMSGLGICIFLCLCGAAIFEKAINNKENERTNNK